MSQRLDNLNGDTAISTIFLVYIGHLQENRRNGLLEIALKSYLKHGFTSIVELGEAYSKFDTKRLSDIMRQQFLAHYIEEEWKYGGLVASDSSNFINAVGCHCLRTEYIIVLVDPLEYGRKWIEKYVFKLARRATDAALALSNDTEKVERLAFD